MSNTQRWLSNLFDAMERTLDADQRSEILRHCGRNCIPKSILKKARACAEGASDIPSFISRLKETIPFVHMSGDEVFVVYPECFCPIMKGRSPLPGLCDCSAGWIGELFEHALSKSVSVEILETVMRGGSECRFRVDLGNKSE